MLTLFFRCSDFHLSRCESFNFLETISMTLNKKSIGKWFDENCPKEHLGEKCLTGNGLGGNSRESELRG